MKIAIIKSTESIESTGGVKIQGLMWRDLLESRGHKVDLVDFWKDYDWQSFDAIIILQFGGICRTLIRDIRTLAKKLVFAPIIDPRWGYKKYKFYTKYWGSQKFIGLTSRFRDMYDYRNLIDKWLVRSEFEASYVEKCLDISRSLIDIVPLNVRTEILDNIPVKENFCLHVSRLADKDKNVTGLIKAAIKYKFNLILAGNLKGEKEQKWMNNLIDGHSNIKYVGRLSEEDLALYYKKAKVFALPSFIEGVGMVALEAAGYGCEIVITNNGGPKYYFDGHAYIVNPYSIDEIGQSIVKALNNVEYQPSLLNYIKSNFSFEACAEKLEQSLKNA